jgi:hypothetical protein
MLDIMFIDGGKEYHATVSEGPFQTHFRTSVVLIENVTV